MLITVNGLVVARRDFGDTSCFADIFTKEYGLIEAAAKGVKKLNHPLSQATALFAYSEFCLNKSNLRYTVNSARILHGFHALSSDLRRLALAAYFAEVIRFTATPEQESGKMLRTALIALYELCRDKYPEQKIKADFETAFSRELGFGDCDGGNPERHLLDCLERESFRTLDYYKSLSS